jgi:hypothetical protein
MNTGLPRKRKVPPKGQNQNNLVEKFFIPFATVIATSIFYFTGWVYISHWYSYYGIDASQVDIPLQLILLHGFPGILFLTICGLISLFAKVFYKKYARELSFSIEDLPDIAIWAYVLASILTFIIAWKIKSIISIPVEVWISSIGFLLLAVSYILLSQTRSFLVFPHAIEAKAEGSSLARIGIIYRMIVDTLKEKGFIAGIILGVIAPFGFDKSLSEKIDQEVDEIKKSAQEESNRIIYIVKDSWRFWIIAMIIFYFLNSISTSAILGELDAVRGARFMMGNWFIPKVSLYSTISISSLKKHEKQFDNNFEYKPFGLLSSDDKSYYLVDWKTTDYYQQKPQVYIVPRNDDLILSFIVSPVGYSVAIPLPTSTLKLTLIPTIPSVTMTPTP